MQFLALASVVCELPDSTFQHAAIGALRRSTFDPARLNGRPVDGGYSIYILFALEGEGGGARPYFLRSSKALVKAIERDDRPAADRELSTLESGGQFNLYEDACFHVAKYHYYAKWGDARQQLHALDRAVSQDFQEHRLPEALYVALQLQRFWLLVRTQDYERATLSSSAVPGRRSGWCRCSIAAARIGAHTERHARPVRCHALYSRAPPVDASNNIRLAPRMER